MYQYTLFAPGWTSEGGHGSFKEIGTLAGIWSHLEQTNMKAFTLERYDSNSEAPEDDDAAVVVRLRRAARHALTDAPGAAALSSAPISGRLTPYKATASYHL